MNTTGTQPELDLQERPTTDVQRWSRLIPEHFRSTLQLQGWAQLPLDELHTELKINGKHPIVEDLIAHLCATEPRYDDADNVRLGEVFLGEEWLPENPRVSLNPDRFKRLEDIFVKLGCVHLYDIWIMGRMQHVATVEKDKDILELWEYLYEYASEVIVENEKREDEENDLEGAMRSDEEFSEHLRREEVQELRKNASKKENHVTHNRFNDTHKTEINNDNRRGVGFWKMTFALAVTALLSGVAVKRGYIDFGKIEHDIIRIIELVHPDELPKAIQVTPDQMREIEARDKQQ